MSTTPEGPQPPQHSHLNHVRRQLEALTQDFSEGAWQPTGVERRLAELLAQSAAGTGALDGASVRAAIWEGSMAAIHENGGRFIGLLADLLPLIEGPEPSAQHAAGLAHAFAERITQTAPDQQAGHSSRARPCPSDTAGDHREVPPHLSPPRREDSRRLRADAARNHTRVLNAAAWIARERGLSHLTMEAVASAAGVGKGTVFRRFGDRAGLLQALLQRSEETFQATHFSGSDPADNRDKAIEQLCAFGVAAIQHFAKELDLQLAAELSPDQRYQHSRRRSYHEQFSVLLSLATPKADAQLLSHTLLGYLEPALLWHLIQQCNLPLQRLESGWLDLVSRLTQESH
ncbi:MULTISPECIES: TetR family transcriptional regulator [unclassified Streptomyces]|uniref:TetR/AcrR family transcriptional regulator n=1 Tax=unclassified Streptomyces TaxID=2593676 RepID=UPI0036EB5B98